MSAMQSVIALKALSRLGPKKSFYLLSALLLLFIVVQIVRYEFPGDGRISHLKVNYDGFSLWLNCERKGAYRFEYIARADTSDLPRQEHFLTDPKVPAYCQQSQSGTYKAPGQQFDRGHLVPANHLDHLPLGIRQSNYMTNILPQAAGMNRGAWLATEEVVECYRDISTLRVIGGVIWGNSSENDYFVRSHGITTPIAFWKVVISREDVIAWLIPNQQEAVRNTVDQYLVSVAHIESITNEQFPLPDRLKQMVQPATWEIPANCNKG